jgi:lipopolysaccharide export system protein LptA
MNKDLGSNAKRLIGNVVCTHKGAIMYCDSAYYYSQTNTLDAFSNVHINEGDTLHLYADTVMYNGQTSFAKARNNVKLVDRATTILTDYMDFDRAKNFGYYIGKGKVVSENNTLTSQTGYYYTNTHMSEFKDSVVLVNPDYTVYSDTMRYNTQTEISYFHGPTDVISDKNTIYCELGYYNTISDEAKFSINAILNQNNGNFLKADTIYYNRTTGFGEAYETITLYDSTRNIILEGNYGYFYEDTERSMVTDSALFISISAEKDSLFIHADTLKSDIDSSENKEILAFYGVNIYKQDLQGMCDSLVYKEKDSIIQMHENPILWSGKLQLTSDFIEIYISNNEADSLKLYNNAFIVKEEDKTTDKFDQIKGTDMTGKISEGKLKELHVDGNAESIFYPKNKNGFIGLNKTISASLKIFMLDNEVERVDCLIKPSATLYPLEKVETDDVLLEDFQWLSKYRPQSKKDIFK